MVFDFILQQIDGNILGPKILGDTTGLSSFWVLFSILLFGDLWGFAGMLIGVPVFAVIYHIISQLVAKGLRCNGQEEMLAGGNNCTENKTIKIKSVKYFCLTRICFCDSINFVIRQKNCNTEMKGAYGTNR